MRILNLTQHAATEDQVLAGVIEPADKKQVMDLLTFDEIPSGEEMAQRASKLAAIAQAAGVEAAMIGGAPYFMGALESALLEAGVEPVYAFSRRVSEDMIQPDGSVRKVAVFRHVGFVRPYSLADEKVTVIPMSPAELADYMVGNGMDIYSASALLKQRK